jgi:hypothetical protein
MLDLSLFPDPYEPILFTGYRSPGSDGTPDVYTTLAHWIESEKFRGSDEDLRDAVLHAPSGKEAFKLAERNKGAVRKTWRALRGRVARAGLLMAAAQNRYVAERLSEIATLTPLEVGIAVDGTAAIGCYAMAFYAGVLWEAADALYNKPNKLLLAAGWKGAISGKQAAIEKHVDKSTTTEVILPISKASSTLAEEFALKNYLPVRYCTAPKGKLSPEFVRDIVALATQVLVIEAKGGKVFDGLIMQARGTGKPVKLVVA